MQQPILFGAAYYPEDWPESERPKDIEMMKKAGMNVMRFGEFAWHNMEPREGEFDFSWLHRVVDDLAANGIKSILGTPTATPPRWFLKKHPEAAMLGADGRALHGGRRHLCSNNPDYQQACARIVEAMGKEFGKDPNVIGWQLDNEIYSWPSGCSCPECEKKFHRFLEDKYGTIENLNRDWNLNLFSQAYDAFDEIPMPIRNWQSPHLHLHWNQFRYQSDIQFIHSHLEILRRYTDAPIGTDMMPVNGMSYEEMTEPMDVIQFNHYNTEENLPTLPFWFDHFRSFGKPFWNTETATCWNGHVEVNQEMKKEGFCRINSWMPVALGGEANLYWLWRQHWAGHELIHGSVLYANGRPMHIFPEVQQISRDFDKARDFLRETSVQSEIALHFTSRSWQLNEVEPIVNLDGVRFNYLERLTRDFYCPINAMGLRPDVIGARKNLDSYKVLVSPMVMTLEDGDLGDRIEAWVRNGGIWIAGPMTDIRNDIGAHFLDRAMGRIERMTGVQLTDSIPGCGQYLPANWTDDGTAVSENWWQELYTPTETGTVLASVTDDAYPTLRGKALIQKIPCGKGSVWLLGTVPSGADFQKLMRLACAEAGLTVPHVTGTVTVVPRSGESRDGLILLETAGASATYQLDKPRKDLLTGVEYAGTVHLNPYDLLILE